MHELADRAGHVVTPLMRLQDPGFSRLLIVTLAESTPVAEASELQDDLRRAGVEPFGWVINASLAAARTRDPLLARRAALEQPHTHPPGHHRAGPPGLARAEGPGGHAGQAAAGCRGRALTSQHCVQHACCPVVVVR